MCVGGWGEEGGVRCEEGLTGSGRACRFTVVARSSFPPHARGHDPGHDDIHEDPLLGKQLLTSASHG